MSSTRFNSAWAERRVSDFYLYVWFYEADLKEIFSSKLKNCKEIDDLRTQNNLNAMLNRE
jgi:hypothetical protein